MCYALGGNLQICKFWVTPGPWAEWAWKARGGYGSQSEAHDNPNARKERIWFSPHCLGDELPLFAVSERHEIP